MELRDLLKQQQVPETDPSRQSRVTQTLRCNAFICAHSLLISIMLEYRRRILGNNFKPLVEQI